MIRYRGLIPLLLFITLSTGLLYGKDLTALQYNSMGNDAMARGRYMEAVDLYKTALEKNPRYKESLYSLARLYFIIEEYEEALKYVEKTAALGGAPLELQCLKGRILIGLGELESAEELFSSLLKSYPNSLEAKLGLAEVNLIFGELERAENLYAETLSVSPESRRALLSLVVLHDSRMEYSKSEKYIDLVLRFYPEDPLVYYKAARHYLKTGDWDMALYHGEKVALLENSYPGLIPLMGYLYILSGKYSEGTKLLQEALVKDQKDSLTWYLLALGNWAMGDLDKARFCFSKALVLSPYDETLRIVYEQFLVGEYPTDNEARLDASRYHIDEGQRFEKKYYFNKALEEYRRANYLAPHDNEGRLLFASLLKKQGFRDKYLERLESLVRDGSESAYINKEIERLKRYQGRGVAEKWNIDQLNIFRRSYNVSFYYIEQEASVHHYKSKQYISQYIIYLLEKNPLLKVNGLPVPISNFSEAYRKSRDDGSDFFIIMDSTELERSFSCQALIFLSSVGTELNSFQVLRSGNRRVVNALEILSQEINSFFPLKATLLEKEGHEGVLDLGAYHNIKKDDTFLIIKRGSIRYSSSEDLLEYGEGDLVGEISVKVLDEEISQGEIKEYGSFDLINPGDDLILITVKDEGDEDSEQNSKPKIDEEIRSQLLKIY